MRHLSYPILTYRDGLKITCSDIEKWSAEYESSERPPLNTNNKLIRKAGYFPIAFIPDKDSADKILDTFACKGKYGLLLVDAEEKDGISGRVLYAMNMGAVKKPQILDA